MVGAATPKNVRVLLVLALTFGGLRNAATECVSTRDLHITTYANSDTELAVDIYIASEHSTGYRKHTHSGHQLPPSCALSPDCAKPLYETYPLESNSSQLISVLPLQNGVALLEYRYSDRLLYTERAMTFDENCDTTTVVRSSQQFYLVCLRANEFSLCEININNEEIQSSFLGEVRTVSNVNTSTLSNSVYFSLDGEMYICYADNVNIYSITLSTMGQLFVGTLSGCGGVSKLEVASISDILSSAIIWARCDDGSTQSFDFLSFFTTINTEATSGTYPYICPVPDVTLEVDLANSRILFGLESTSQIQPTTLPGTSFRSDSGICFEVQNITLMAFIDEETGVYVYNSSAANVTKLYDLQPCFSEEHDCLPLLLFDSRYLHVREQGRNTLIDTHKNFEVVINQLVAVDLVTVFGDLERSEVLEVTPSPTGVLSSSISDDSSLMPTSSTANETQVVRDPSSSSESNTNIVIYACTIGGVMLVIATAVVVIAALLYFKRAFELNHRSGQGHDPPAGEGPITMNPAYSTSLGYSNPLENELEPSGDEEGPVRRPNTSPQGTGRTLTQQPGAGGTQPSQVDDDNSPPQQDHHQSQDGSQDSTRDGSPTSQLDSQGSPRSTQTIQPEETSHVTMRDDPEGSDGSDPPQELPSHNEVTVLAEMPSETTLQPGVLVSGSHPPPSIITSTAAQLVQERDQSQSPTNANHNQLELPTEDSMHRSQASSNASSTSELLRETQD